MPRTKIEVRDQRSIPFNKEKDFELYRLFYYLPEKFYKIYISPEYEPLLRWIVEYFIDRKQRAVKTNDNLWKERFFRAEKIQLVTISDPEKVFFNYLEKQREGFIFKPGSAPKDYRVGTALNLSKAKIKEIRENYKDFLKKKKRETPILERLMESQDGDPPKETQV